MTTTGVSSVSAFTLSYEGPALAENAMSARDLGPALTAIGAFFDRSNSLLFGDSATIDLKIATTRQGSFDIDLVVQMVSKLASVLTNPIVVSAPNFRHMLVVVIGLFKRLRGSTDASVDNPDQELIQAMEHITVHLGEFEMTVEGSVETVQTVAQEALRLMKDPMILKAVQGVVAPVRGDGIDRMSIKEHNRELEHAEKADLASFETPRIESNSSTRIERQSLGIISTHFRKGQWQLHDGTRTNSYSIKDDYFSDLVSRGEISFTYGDKLVCRVRDVEYFEDGHKVRTEYEIIEVIQHLQGSDGESQLPMLGVESDSIRFPP